MKKKGMLAFMAVLIMFLAAGCQKGEENRKEEALRPWSDALTEMPVQEIEGTVSQNPGAEQEEKISELKISFREETEEEKDGDFVDFKSILYYPVFSGENAEAMNRFAETITETFREVLPEAKENAKFDFEDSLLGEYIVSIFPEKEELIISSLWETEQYITLFAKSVSSTGGVHPNVSCRAYVVDVTTGEAKSMEQMLKPYSLTTESVVADKPKEDGGAAAAAAQAAAARAATSR